MSGSGLASGSDSTRSCLPSYELRARSSGRAPSPTLNRVLPVRGKVGRPRRRPDIGTADRGNDHDKYRRELRGIGVASDIARRKTEHGSGLGRVRWVVERTFAWLHHYKRLLVRYDRRHDMHEAFLALACCLVCYRRLQPSF